MGLTIISGFGLRDLESEFLPLWSRAEDDIATLLRDAYKRSILLVGAYDTGAFYRSVIRSPNAFLDDGRRVREVIADTSTTSEGARDYADIVERGRLPPVNYPGRFPALLAIESSEPEIELILEATANTIAQRMQANA